MMRIIAGKHRGRTIEVLAEKGLRPTTGKVREALFNLLKHGKFMKEPDFIQDDNPSLLEGRRVIDIFCGSGALGLEALSRGASHAVFVDQNTKVMALARSNAEKLHEEENCTFIRSDSTQLPKAVEPCMVAFLDPPYLSGLSHAGLKTLSANGWLERGAIVIVEQSKKEALKLPPDFYLVDERFYNLTRISLLQYRPG